MLEVDINAEMAKQPEDRHPDTDEALFRAALAHGVRQGDITQELADEFLAAVLPFLHKDKLTWP